MTQNRPTKYLEGDTFMSGMMFLRHNGFDMKVRFKGPTSFFF